jgi:hypothetical protein
VKQVHFSIACGGLGSGESMLIPGSEDARLAIAADGDSDILLPFSRTQRLRQPTLDATYIHDGAPAGLGIGTAEVAVHRAVQRYEDLFEFLSYWSAGCS